MEPEPPGAASFCLEPEPTQVGRSRSRLRDLGNQEPEPPKKVAAPQHWYKQSSIHSFIYLLFSFFAGSGSGTLILGPDPGKSSGSATLLYRLNHKQFSAKY